MTWLWVGLAVWLVGCVFVVALGMAAAQGDRIQSRAVRESHMGRERIGLRR